MITAREPWDGTLGRTDDGAEADETEPRMMTRPASLLACPSSDEMTRDGMRRGETHDDTIDRDDERDGDGIATR